MLELESSLEVSLHGDIILIHGRESVNYKGPLKSVNKEPQGGCKGGLKRGDTKETWEMRIWISRMSMQLLTKYNERKTKIKNYLCLNLTNDFFVISFFTACRRFPKEMSLIPIDLLQDLAKEGALISLGVISRKNK